VLLDSSSDECTKLAASWIRDCTENHKDCLQFDQTPLPTRVIAVGSDLEEPYLYSSKKENANYIALSHCWGGMVPMTTTLETLAQRQRQIRFSELPKTFQDAITITRKLKVPYIWIDSLCIIQDSTEDWEIEAATMGTVYRNSLVCIAADGAENNQGGCFIKGHPSRNLDICCVSCPGISGKESSIHIRKRPTPMSGFGFAHVQSGSQYSISKLDTRGWVLQEQALARRTLHYTAAEMSWDCATSLQCECTCLAEEVERSSSTMQLRACKLMMQNPDKLLRSQWTQKSMWPNFVELFTQRCLTYDTDRLHAMSGIAAMISSSQESCYLAGLWKGEFPLNLLWRTKADYHTSKTIVSRRQQSYYAPSWSWASVTGPVEYIALPGRSYNFDLDPRLDIIEAACTPIGSNPYGPAQFSYLKVSGLLGPIDYQLELPGPKNIPAEDPGESKPIRRGFDCDVIDNTGLTEFIEGEPLWFLLVASGRRRDRGFSRLEGHHCLVLRRSLQDPNCFERVGCAWSLKEYWVLELSKKAEIRSITLL
jgi:hypothetical protein